MNNSKSSCIYYETSSVGRKEQQQQHYNKNTTNNNIIGSSNSITFNSCNKRNEVVFVSSSNALATSCSSSYECSSAVASVFIPPTIDVNFF